MLKIILPILLLLALNVQAAPPPGVITQALADLGIEPRRWVITNRGASEINTGPFRPGMMCK